MAWTYTESGNNSATSSWNVDHPAASTGDLIIFNIGWDDSTNVTALTPPSGPNGESAVVIEDVVASGSTAVRGKIVYYVATGAWSAGSLTFTPSASEQWTAAVIHIPSGEFDATTPLGASNNLPSASTTTSPDLASLTAGSTDGGGTVVGFMVGDVDDPDGSITGWTEQVSTDRGAVGIGLWTRDTVATDSESISAASGATFPSARQYVSFTYIVRAGNQPPTVAIADNTTTIFNDTFTDTTGTNLNAHTPNTGTGWTKLIEVGGTINLEIDTNQAVSDGSLSEGTLYTADATYPSPNYSVQTTYVSNGSFDATVILAVRIQDSDNMYAAKLSASASQLYKKVSGSWSTVGSAGSAIAEGSVAKLEIFGTTLTLYDDNAVVVQQTVTDLSDAGKAGLGMGAVITAGDDVWTQTVDDFSVTSYPEISDSTPDITFTGTDADGDDIRYRIEIRKNTITNFIAAQDNFNDNSVNTTLWNNWGGSQVLEQNNQLEVSTTTAASYFGTETNSTYNLTGKCVIIELISAGNQSISQFDAIPIQLYADSNNKLEWAINNGTIKARKIVASSLTNVATNTYNSSTHKWLRIRESGGTTYWDYSTDGSSWTNFASDTNPITITGLTFSIIVGNQSAASSGTTMIVDNFNYEAPVVEAVSGTDSGFSGSPDNTDPFASDQAVTYTVQSALSNDTYYYTVFAIDPSGSNTYGVGSTEGSFTLVSSGITSTKTITGQSRITTTATKTIQGLSRITATTTKTILGRARVQITSSQTIQGLSRITATATKTILGQSRITATTLKTIQGLSRITATATKTIDGLSRIVITSTQTIQGLARITASASQTILGRARITASTSQTIQGLSRVTATATKTIDGLSTITAVGVQTLLGRARITASNSTTIQGLSRITASATQTILGLSRISITTTKTILGQSRITTAATTTIQGLSRITATTTKTIQGLSRITITSSQTILGRARVNVTSSTAIQGLSKITGASAQTITGLARITTTTTKTILGTARIQISSSKTILGRSRVQISSSQTIQGLSRVTASATKTILGLSRVTASGTKTILGNSRITAVATKTITGIAKISSDLISGSQTILGQSRITTSTAKTITGKASISSNIVPTPKQVVYVNGHFALRITDLIYLPV